MKCEQAQSLLVSYLNNETTPSERALIQAHLSGCMYCQEELSRTSDVQEQIGSALQHRAAQAQPSAAAWDRLEARLAQASQPVPAKTWLSRIQQNVSRRKTLPTSGDITMRKRIILVTGTAVLTVALVAIAMFNVVAPVSAQTIIERASQAQALDTPTQGIWHTQIEIYQNKLALEGDQAGTTKIDENFTDLATGYYRFTTVDASGKILEIGAFDGSFNYLAQQPENSTESTLTIHRTPLSQDDRIKAGQGRASVSEVSLFDSFRANPRVELIGKETRPDGRQVYVLVNKNFQTKKLANGQTEQTYSGSMSMTFDAKTYELLESETTVHKNDKDIVIEKVNFLLDETLPTENTIAWDLSDLQNVTFVDDSPVEQTDQVTFVPLSLEELATHAHTYALKNIPAGFSMEIVAQSPQPANEPFAYEVHYTNPANEDFNLQAVGVMDAGFVDLNFYDGSYRTAAGLVLNYSPSGGKTGTSAMLTTPDGVSFLVFSSMPREQVQALVEDLVMLK